MTSSNGSSLNERSILKQMLETPLKEVESLTRLLVERDAQRCEEEDVLLTELEQLRLENQMLGYPYPFLDFSPN